MTLYEVSPETTVRGRMIRTVGAGPVSVLLAQLLMLAAVAVAVDLSGAGLSPAAWAVGAACGLCTNAALARGLSYYRAERLSPADWVTLARATLVVGVAALVVDSFGEPAPVSLLLSFATLALALDAVDGWVARRTRTMATLGARFDGEVDAFLILVLSVYVARSAGLWVLAIGAARYVFLVAGWPLPWLREQLPPRFWRKTVAALQGVVLTVAAAHLLSPAVTVALLVVALGLLAESFGRDVWWLAVRRDATPTAMVGGQRHGTLTAAVVDDEPSQDEAMVSSDIGGSGVGPAFRPAHTPGPRRRTVRRGTGITLTLLAVVVVWAALVSPDQPSDLSITGFLRIPLEGLVLVALASVLPVIARRILAGIVGPLLALVVVFKALDIGFIDTFNRRFDLLSDKSYAGTGIETLRASIGRTDTNLVVIGVVLGVIALFVLTTFSTFRLTGIAAANRRWALGIVAALGGVWALLGVLDAQFIPHTPIASTVSADVVVKEVGAVRSDIHDQAVFAKEIKHDAFRNTPPNQLLTSLRGKDVLLVFEEAYGQQAVEGRQFSPEVDAVLSRGDKQLASAGFSERSGFLTSATYGGISWLAHSTLQSGLWVDNQRRYNDLVSTQRFTLSDAFKEAGWRTVDDVPSDDYYWPQGTSFYHYDKLYSRLNVGYQGPTFTYASMPDQYVFAALQRLELAKPHRKPLFAEVDTVSSHMPWNRIPVQIPWNEVGNGSIYDRIPMIHETGAFWSNPARVQAAYGRSVVYSMSTLISFVQHYGKKNLVMIVLGDHQPLPIVSGHNSNHDVPISIIAHDPKVLKQIGSWGWNPGLQPRPNAPVWPMSAFRDRFLAAFDAHPAAR